MEAGNILEDTTSVKEDEAFWKHHAKACETSGLTRTAYCRLHKLNYHRFGYWLHKWAQQALPLIPVTVKADTPTLLCSLRLNHQHTLYIHDQKALAFILEILR